MEKHLFSMLAILSATFFLSFSDGALAQGVTGPSSSASPYLVPTYTGANFTSIITAGNIVGSYKMVGLPDGLGAFDNGNGTFTVLMNHELGNSSGIVRAHGSKGAFVSKWVINKSDLSVVSGEDLMKKVNLWSSATSSYTEYSSSNPSSLTAFNRLCSADLPAVSAFYNSVTGLGTQERIFMDGEEAGNEGRAMGHIATGPNAGTSYELPYLGKFSWENALANPATGDKTVVAGTDDATPGQVYFYIGTKTNTGTEIEKAGLSNGKLYGPVVAGMAIETSGFLSAAGTAFTMADLGSVQNITGTTLQANSVTAGVTQFLRPEDGAWDPSHPNDFYFVTTNAFGSPSRLWRMHFSDLNDLTLGGTITAVLDGTEGQQMLDNITIDNAGHILLVEDVGNNAHLGKVWQYNIATDVLTQVGSHDATRFITGGANFLTQDEEASGIIDVQSILGPGMFLTVDQAHYGISGEVVEGGQLLVFYNPAAINKPPVVTITNPVTGNPYNAGSNINLDVLTSDTDGIVTKVEFYNNGIKFAEDTTAPFSYAGQMVEAANYVLTAKATDNNGASTISDTVSITVSACTGSGSITGEGYLDIPGSAVTDLTSNPKYPNNPDIVASLNTFEYKNVGDNYGARVRGYICAPVTGDYTFYVAGDDQAALYLSTDENPDNKVLIAYNLSYVASRAWNTYPTQKSAPVHLVKGARYYIEALHKEYTSNDHLAVAWTMPGAVFEAPIPGNRLSAWSAPVSNAGAASGVNFSTVMQLKNANGLTITASPNPSQTHFTINIISNSDQAVTVTLMDISGKVVERKLNVVANGSVTVGGSLRPGVYFVEVTQGSNKQRLKLVKQ